eukprot:jgi/Ulvmu1/7066/UM033_0126.1
MESEDSDVCLTTGRGVDASPSGAGAIAYSDLHGNNNVNGTAHGTGAPSQGDAGHTDIWQASPSASTEEKQLVQQHQSPRREFLLRQSQLGASFSRSVADSQHTGPSSMSGQVPDASAGLKQWQLTKQHKIESDENQSSEGNAGNSESHTETGPTMLGQGKLHLPAFERLMQVMNRLDTPDASGSGPAALQAEAWSPLREPVPAESPSAVSMRRFPADAAGPVTHNNADRAQLQHSPNATPPVSSHPIGSFDGSNQSVSSDACGPPPKQETASKQQATPPKLMHEGHDSPCANQRGAWMSEPIGRQHAAALTIPPSIDGSTAGPSPALMPMAQLSEAVVALERPQDTPPAKSRRRSQPQLSSRSLVAPDLGFHVQSQPGKASAVISSRACEAVAGGSAPKAAKLTCVTESAAHAGPEAQLEPQDSALTSQLPEPQPITEPAYSSCASRPFEPELQNQPRSEPFPQADPAAAVAGAQSEVPVGREASRGSVSEKEELLQFLGNLSHKHELDVDVKALSPTGSAENGSAAEEHCNAPEFPQDTKDRGRTSFAFSAIAWESLNKHLHANGFTPFATEAGTTSDAFLFSVRDSVTSVLEEFERRGALVQQLLSVADGSASERSKHLSELKSVQRERDGLNSEVKKVKQALAKESSLRKDEAAKKVARIQGLENDAKKLLKELESAKRSSQSMDSLQDNIANQRKALQSDIDDLKKRCATSSDATTKLQAENKRLQGYVKKLEATQRAKDAKLQELEDFKRGSIQKLDSMERVSSAASKDAQNYEAQLQGLHRQLREAQAAARVLEQDSEKVQADLARATTAGQLAEERATVAEASLKDASTQLRVMATRVTALESQLRAKDAELEDATAAAAAARDGRSETESRILQLQADLRGACADTAALTAQLGVQTAAAHSREVEVEELKAAVQSASVREEVAEGALGDTVSEVRRLKAECSKHQCLIKTQVAALRAREAELDSVRASYTAAEARTDNLTERLKVSGMELRTAEESLKAQQRLARSLKQRLDDSEAQCDSQRAVLQDLQEHQGDAKVMSKNAAQQLVAAQAESARLRAALHACENQMASQDARIAALHSNLHLLDSHKDDLRAAVADASGAAARAGASKSALESRVRALQTQIRDRDNTIATLKEQISEFHTQREQAQEVLNEHARETKAAAARSDAAASRELTLTTQLSARGEEVAALREQVALVAEEMEAWRANGKALTAQVDAAERARAADAGKLSVAMNQARMHEETAQALRAQLAKMGANESTAADAAADSHRELWRVEAMLAAERDRVRLLENQLADATTRCEATMAEVSVAQADGRAARSEAADAGRRGAHADALVKTLQGRVKVLEAQGEAAVLLEAELRGRVQQGEGERGAAAAAAAKESAALSSALRAARARLVVLEKQINDRDKQLGTLRDQLTHMHEAHASADLRSADAAKDLRGVEQQAANAETRMRLMHTQLQALQQENQGLRESLGAEADLRRHDAAKASDSAAEVRALNTRVRSLRTATKIAEHQLQEKVREAEALRAALQLREEDSNAAIAVLDTAGIDKEAQEAAVRQAQQRAVCLQRRLDSQQGTLQHAQQDALDAGQAADEARRHAAALSAELQRESARATAALLRCAGLEEMLAAAEAEAAEVRAVLLERETAAGAAAADSSSHVRGLEAQVRGLQGCGRVLENRVADVEAALADAHDAAAAVHEKHDAAVARATQRGAALERLQLQLAEARKAHAVAKEVATEREAELEALREQLTDTLKGHDAVAGAGEEIARSERSLRAGLAALHSEVRSLHAALAERDAEAGVAEQARQQAQQAVRDARHEAAAAHARCEGARRQLRTMQGQVRRQAAAAEAATEDAEAARGAVLTGEKRVSDAEAEAKELAVALQRATQRQAAAQKALAQHDEAAGRAAQAAADAQRVALEERLCSAEARKGAADASAMVEVLQREVDTTRAAYTAQVAAAEAAAAATAELRATAMDQAAEMQALSAAVDAEVGRADGAAREAAGVRAQLQKARGELQQREEALRAAQAALQQGSVDRAVGRVEETRAEASLDRAGASIETLKSDIKSKSAAIQELRQALAELEGVLKEEKRQHTTTRAEAGAAGAALARKVAALHAAEAELETVRGHGRETEALLRELSQAKLEDGGQQAAERRAQHMHAAAVQRADTQAAQLKQQLTLAHDRCSELEGTVAVLQKALDAARQDAAARNVADAGATATAQRAGDEVQKLRRQVAAAEQQAAEVRREKEAAVAQVQASANERQRTSEELSKAAKAMILAQKQIEGSKRKAAAHAADLQSARAEMAELKHAAAQSQRDARQAAASGPHVRKLEAEVTALRQRLREAQSAHGAEAEARQQVTREAGQLEETAEEASVQLRRAQDDLAESNKDCGHLRLQVAQLTHGLREGEKRLERCREQLAVAVGREERLTGKARQTYARLKSAWAQAKGSSKAAGAISAAARELRPVEIVGIYEEQRAQTDTELKRLAAENEVLLRQVRDLENRVTLTTRELSSGGQPAAVELQAKLADLERSNANLQAELQKRDVSSGDTARMHARQLAEACTRGDTLAEENASLLLELNARPAHKDYAALRREADILRQRLAQAELRRGGPGGDATAAAAELDRCTGSAAAAAGRLMTTRERIARDKHVARLGLQAVDGLPHGVLVELVQDVCVTLDCSDATHMHAAVLRTLRAANRAAELDALAERLSDCVFRQGAALVPPHLRAGERDLNALVPVLQSWQEQLHDSGVVERTLEHVRDALALRGGSTPGGAAPPSLQQVVAQVQELVEGEGRARATHDAFASVEQELRANPQGGLQRVVKHFQDLFGVTSIEGCLPMMSKVYAEHRAGQTFLLALSDMLCMPRSSAACLDCIQGLLDSRDEHERSQSHGTQGAAPQALTLDREERDETVKLVCAALGCSSVSGMLPAVQGLTTRLLKLDGLIPRYQRVLSKVYDLLEITSLDEVVPALENALR